MIGVLIESAETLSVHDEDRDRVTLGCRSLDGLAPDPDSLFNSKTLLSIRLFLRLNLTNSCDEEMRRLYFIS